MAFCGCNTSSDVPDIIRTWTGREIDIPDDVLFANSSITSSDYKIVNYIDSVGCMRCKSQLPLWQSFIDTAKAIFDDKLSVCIIMHPKRWYDAEHTIKKDSFPYPVCIDINDSLNKLNHFPSDPRFHCFLLDENNKVILIGNPVQNPKIKELYLRTICERLGIEYNQNSDAKMDSKNEINLGSFPKSESKSVQIFIPNNTKSVIQIDTVFTSCECTTASIDKMIINPDDKATLNVAYTPDGTGDFLREVYVKIRGEDKPKTFIIRGNVK